MTALDQAGTRERPRTDEGTLSLLRSVTAIVSDGGAVGSYRVLHALAWLSRKGVACRAVPSGAGALAVTDADVIVVQRQHDLGLLPRLREAAAAGATIVYEIDDDLHHIPPQNPVHPLYNGDPRVLDGVERLMRAAHGLTVSTPELADAYRRYNPNVHVVPNAIDFGLRTWGARHPRPDDGRVRIGWAGGATHVEDLRPLAPVVREVLARRPEADFVVMTTPGLASWIERDWGLDPRRFTAIEYQPFASYPQALTRFDIGLAPLADDAFNACKSNLKVLEYGAVGLPVVASPVAPYARTITHGVNGFLARTPKEWIARLDALVLDPALRRQAGSALEELVRAEHDMNRAWVRWPQAWDAIAASAAAASARR